MGRWLVAYSDLSKSICTNLPIPPTMNSQFSEISQLSRSICHYVPLVKVLKDPRFGCYSVDRVCLSLRAGRQGVASEATGRRQQSGASIRVYRSPFSPIDSLYRISSASTTSICIPVCCARYAPFNNNHFDDLCCAIFRCIPCVTEHPGLVTFPNPDDAKEFS